MSPADDAGQAGAGRDRGRAVEVIADLRDDPARAHPPGDIW